MLWYGDTESPHGPARAVAARSIKSSRSSRGSNHHTTTSLPRLFSTIQDGRQHLPSLCLDGRRWRHERPNSLRDGLRGHCRNLRARQRDGVAAHEPSRNSKLHRVQQRLLLLVVDRWWRDCQLRHGFWKPVLRFLEQHRQLCWWQGLEPG